MLEAVIKVLSVLDNLHLDEILGWTLWAASQGLALIALPRHEVRVAQALLRDTWAFLELFDHALLGLGNVGKGAFGQTHEFAVLPVIAYREVRRVFASREQEKTLLARRERGCCEAGTRDAHQQVTLVDVKHCSMCPLTIAALPPSR